MKTIFRNLLKAIGIMAYFVILNIAYVRMNVDRLMNDIEIFAGTFLVFGLIMLEIAYKKDSGKTAISGIELLVLSMHSLSIKHVIAFYEYDFRFYLLTSSYVFAIYYVLKSIIIYTKEKRKYLKNLSDISEIVKEEPIKKEAKKRRKIKEEKFVVENEKNRKTEKENKAKKETKKVNKKDKEKKEQNKEENEQINKEDKKEKNKEETKKKKTTTKKTNSKSKTSKSTKKTNKEDKEKEETIEEKNVEEKPKRTRKTTKKKKEVEKDD